LSYGPTSPQSRLLIAVSAIVLVGVVAAGLLGLVFLAGVVAGQRLETPRGARSNHGGGRLVPIHDRDGELVALLHNEFLRLPIRYDTRKRQP
jgi:hypothetical protein